MPSRCALAHQLGDALDQAGFVDLVGQLGDDDAALAALHLLDVRLRLDGDPAASLAVGGFDALLALLLDDDAAGGEVGTLDEFHQVVDVDVVQLFPLLEHEDAGIDDLRQVVGRDVGRHADGDAGGTVDQQVGEGGGQDERFAQGAVEVVGEVDRVLADVGQQVQGGRRQAGFGVAHGSRRVAIHRAEVALPVDEQGAHGEILRHACHGFVDGGIAVRVVLAEHLADDAGGLAVGAVDADAHVVHGVQDAALDGLETVAGIRQGAGDDDGHGVIEVGSLHLVVDIDFANETEFHDGSWAHPRESGGKEGMRVIFFRRLS